MPLLDSRRSGVRALIRNGQLDADGVRWSPPFECALDPEPEARGRCCGITLADVEFAEFEPRVHAEIASLRQAEDSALGILKVPGR